MALLSPKIHEIAARFETWRSIGSFLFGWLMSTGVISQWPAIANQGWAAVLVIGLLLACAVLGVLALLYLALADFLRNRRPAETATENQPKVSEPADPEQKSETASPNRCVVELTFRSAEDITFRRWWNLHDLTYQQKDDQVWQFYVHFHSYFLPRFVTTRVMNATGEPENVQSRLIRTSQRYCIVAVKRVTIPGALQIDIAGEAIA